MERLTSKNCSSEIEHSVGHMMLVGEILAPKALEIIEAYEHGLEADQQIKATEPPLPR